jgi:predicted Zn-dependent protease
VIVPRFAITLALVASLAAGCALTVEQERGLGDQFSRQIESQKRVVRDPAVVSYVRGVGARLAAAAGPQPFPITWNVLVDKEVNAFAGPGGYVYVNTGLITRARNVSELAAVMAHELSHVTLRHVSAAVARQQQTSILGAGIAAATNSEGWGQVASTGAGIWNLRYDRSAERQADRNGVALMQRAGYDPNGMVTMFQLLMQTGSSGGGGFLSSHPGVAQRIEYIQADIRALPPGPRVISSDGQLPAIQSRLRAGLVSGDVGGARDTFAGQGGAPIGGAAIDPNGYPDEPGAFDWNRR